MLGDERITPGLLQGREYNDHQHGGGKRRHYYMTHDGYNVYSSGGACLRHADLATALRITPDGLKCICSPW